MIGANAIGRLAPKTGEIKIVHVPTKNALPYGIAVNADGVPYFAEFGTNKIASINPQTMAISEYPLPDAASRPRRIAIASDGAIWYTDYARGFLGRLDPKTGKRPRLAVAQRSGLRPLRDCCGRRRDLVQRIRREPKHARAFRSAKAKDRDWPIPSGGGVVRNMTATRDGKLVLACSGVDRIALVDVR